MNGRAGIGIAAGVAGLLVGAAVVHLGDRVADRAQTDVAVRNYLLAHPEVIPEALQRLQSQDTARTIQASRQAIEAPFAGAWAGNPKGDVTLVMFTDYACGYCRASTPDIERLLASDPKLKVVWREIPVLGPDSEVAARAALAAAKQGRYLAFHRALFAGGRPDAPHLAQAAQAAGLDPARLQADRSGADVARELDANIALATQLKVEGTPAFVVGNEMLGGAVGYDRLAQAITAARAAKG